MRAQRTATVHHVIDERTAAVELSRQVIHPKYGKRYRRTTTLLADTATDLSLAPGAVVTIEAIRPISKRKAWRVISVQPGRTARITPVAEDVLADGEAS